MTKLQLTLTDEEAKIFSYRASKLGYDLTRFVKYQLSRLAEEYQSDIASSPMSLKTEKIVSQAQEDYKNNKLKKTSSLNNLFT